MSLFPLYTHGELVDRAERWLVNTQRCMFVFKEFGVFHERPDAIGWKYGSSILVECKTSRADFFADRKKLGRRMPELGMGQRRYYLVEPELVLPDEMPEGWGLLYALPKYVRVVKRARPFHRYAQHYEWKLLLTALGRLHAAGVLETIYEPPWRESNYG